MMDSTDRSRSLSRGQKIAVQIIGVGILICGVLPLLVWLGRIAWTWALGL